MEKQKNGKLTVRPLNVTPHDRQVGVRAWARVAVFVCLCLGVCTLEATHWSQIVRVRIGALESSNRWPLIWLNIRISVSLTELQTGLSTAVLLVLTPGHAARYDDFDASSTAFALQR